MSVCRKEGTIHLWLESKASWEIVPKIQIPAGRGEAYLASSLMQIVTVEEGLVRATSRWQISEEFRSHLQVWWCTGALEAPETSVLFRTKYHTLLTNVYYYPQLPYAGAVKKGEQSSPGWKGIQIPPLLGRTFWFSSKSFEETFPLPSTQNVVAQVNSKLVCWFFFFWKYKYVHLEVSNFVWYKEEHFSAGCFLETGSKKAGKETMSMITEFVLYSVVVQNSELK